MEVSKLKIGNHVFDDLNEIVKIEVLYSPFYMEWDSKEFPAAFSKYGNDRDIFESQINPIPLTLPFLEKFGFSAEGYLKGYIGKDFKIGAMTADFVLQMPGELSGFFTYKLANHFFAELKYVHELQNLYSFLTDQELSLF